MRAGAAAALVDAATNRQINMAHGDKDKIIEANTVMPLLEPAS